MNAVDTSVVVAGVASWHEGHRLARAILDQDPRLPAHCAVEAFSVLTRLPPPHRLAAGQAWQLLADRFRSPYLTLPAADCRRLLGSMATRAIRGGAVYDALVAATVRRANATLITRDHRAAETYRRMDVSFDLIG